jgi:hypothetical protein
MFSKIQPQQISLHSFSSPSGDVVFSQGDSFVYADLARNLIGDFNFDGSLRVNGNLVGVTPTGSNSYDPDINIVIGGESNFVSGFDNVLVNSRFATVNGQDNTVINAYYADIPSSSTDNTVLGGTSVYFNSGIKGSMVLKDQSAINAVFPNKSNALYITFASGIYVSHKNLYLGEVLATNWTDLSGVSGDINTRLNSTGYALDYKINNTSGAINTQLISTGQTLNTKIDANSGAINTRLIDTDIFFNTKIATTSGILDSRIISTGLILDNKINALSGSVSSMIANQGGADGTLNFDGQSGISWVDGKIVNEGSITLFSTGSGAASGVFSGNGVAGNLLLNGQTAASWANGLITTTEKSFNFLSSNNATGALVFNGVTGVAWASGQVSSTGVKSYNYITGNTTTGSLIFATGPSSSGIIAWNSGLITTTGNFISSGGGGAGLPINSGDYIFPPAGWEEFPMNFIDTDGFLRTKIFLTKIE